MSRGTDDAQRGTSDGVPRFRAFCDDPLCRWKAEDARATEDEAYEDVNAHMQVAHYSVTGVLRETTDTEDSL